LVISGNFLSSSILFSVSFAEEVEADDPFSADSFVGSSFTDSSLELLPEQLVSVMATKSHKRNFTFMLVDLMMYSQNCWSKLNRSFFNNF